MIYITKNRKNNRKITFWISLIFICIFITFQYFWPSFIPAMFTNIVTPYWRTEFAIQSGSLGSVEDLLRENESLKRQIADNEAKMAIVESVNSENLELRNLLKISSSTLQSSSIVVPIIKRSPSGLYDQLIIDAGKDKGVSTTSLVYASGNIPVGRVTDVFSQTSKVILFYSPDQRHDVLLADKIPATAIGLGGGQYEVSIPRGLNVAVGDFVYSANIDGKPMGKIVYINADSSLAFEKVLFSVPINIYELRWVTVETNK
jgi:cell shape-determining protein MreC